MTSKKMLGLAAALILGLAPGLFAQPAATGNIYGTVTDDSGAVMPGAAVTLSGPQGSRSTTSGTQGDFRFLNVPHGTHKLTVALTGFATVNREVIVARGPERRSCASPSRWPRSKRASPSPRRLRWSTPRRSATCTTVEQGRAVQDPDLARPVGHPRHHPGRHRWTASTWPATRADSRRNYMGKGADPKNNVWAIDGVVITDMATFGASPTYYTYDSFDQVAVTTGGNDITVATGGGGHRLHDQARARTAGTATRSATSPTTTSSRRTCPTSCANDPRLQGNDKADHTEQITDYNFDLGGPILKDKLWIWGSWGREDIRIKRLTQTRDKTELVTKTAKLNWQASSKDMISAFWFLGSKIKIGRSPGSGLTEDDSFLWDQGDFFPQQPHGLSKVEWNRTFTPELLPEREVGVLLDRLHPRRARRRRGPGLQLPDQHRERQRQQPGLPPSPDHLAARRQLLLRRHGRQPRAASSAGAGARRGLLRERLRRATRPRRASTPPAATARGSSATRPRTPSPSTTAPTSPTPSPRTASR